MSVEISKKARAAGFLEFEAIHAGVSQKKAFTSATSQATAVATNCTIVRVVATQNCHLAFGSNPTAVADGTGVYLVANIPEYFGITPGYKIAVIRDSADGNLFITEGA